MKFPDITTPTYEVQLLFRKKPVKFRPFLVKEQKLMLIAVESKDPIETVKILKQVAKNCIIDEDVNVEELPYVDLEKLFLNFRARSMGEVVDVHFKCRHEITDEAGNTKECGMIMQIPVNLLEVPIVNNDIDSKIMITEKIGVQMKIPTFELMESMLEDGDSYGDFKTIAQCVEYVFDENGVYYAKDATLDEMIDFLINLPPDKYEKLEKFFEKLPKVKKELNHICGKCKHNHNLVLEGLGDFFI